MPHLPIARGPAALLVFMFSMAAAAGDFKLAFIDVGQGDATVVISPSGCAAVLDGGPTGSGAEIKAFLKSEGISHVDFAVTSHYHADHIGGIDELDVGTDAVTVGAVYDRGGSYSSATYTAYAEHFAGRRRTLIRGEVFTLCSEVTFRVEAVNGNGISTSSENGRSVAVKISYGSFDALVGGDLTSSSPNIEQTLVGQTGEVEVYKVHHHGSASSSGAEMLNELKPTVSVISVGYKNNYGHPTPEALSRLEAVGSDIYMTEDPATATILGDVVVSSPTGATYLVAQGAYSQSYASKGGDPVDVTPPSAPSDLVASASGADGVDLVWTAATDDVGVTGYRVYRSSDGGGFTLAGSTQVTGFAESGLLAGGTYAYRVSALDAAGNESAVSNTAQITLPASGDTQAPSAPANLLASAAGTDGVDLSWTPSSDDRGVTGYRVYRSADGGGFTLAGSTQVTGFAESGLSPGGTYAYRVTALDAAGNESAASDTAQLTLESGADTQAPTAPTSLFAAASGSFAIELSWSGATDDVGVTGYRLYRSPDGASWTLHATLTATAYSDTGLSAGTPYWYRVRAEDGAGNLSGDSAAAAATTASETSPGLVIINEVLANEPGSATSGEFVELVNVGGAAVDLGGWTLSDGSSVRHRFPAGTWLAGGEAMVVFGGAAGIPAGTPNAVAASTGQLNLNNTGDTVTLAHGKRRQDRVKLTSALASADGVSANRGPDATAGAALVLHTELSPLGASPGARPSGAAY